MYEGDNLTAHLYNDYEAQREAYIATVLPRMTSDDAIAFQRARDAERGRPIRSEAELVEEARETVNRWAQWTASIDSTDLEIRDLEHHRERGALKPLDVDPSVEMLPDGRALVWLNDDDRTFDHATIWEDRGDKWVKVVPYDKGRIEPHVGGLDPRPMGHMEVE